MKKKLATGLAVGLCMYFIVGVCAASQYNATTDFSIANGNPNGVWSYGWMPNDTQGHPSLSQFNPYTGYHLNLMLNSPRWFRNPPSWDFTPTIWRLNDTYQGWGYGVAPGQLSLHPSGTYEASVLRFTAPIDGNYHIDGQFLAGDARIMQLGVCQGSEWLWRGNDYGSFTLAKRLAAGQTIDFLVYGAYYNGNTPLELIIESSPVPIPGAVWLLGSGLLGLIGLKRRFLG